MSAAPSTIARLVRAGWQTGYTLAEVAERLRLPVASVTTLHRHGVFIDDGSHIMLPPDATPSMVNYQWLERFEPKQDLRRYDLIRSVNGLLKLDDAVDYPANITDDVIAFLESEGAVYYNQAYQG